MSGNNPIIFIPGALGSRLYDIETGELVWFSPVGFLKNRKNIGIEHKFSVKNQLLNLTKAKKKEHGTTLFYKRFIEDICRRFPNRAVYFFSYDFRNSCIDSAEMLNDVIGEVLKAGNAEKADIAAHSLGGLVISAYAAIYGFDKLGKVVTLGAPFEGLVDAIKDTVTGRIIRLPIFILNFLGFSKDLFREYPSYAEMFPSVEYHRAHPFIIDGIAASEEDYRMISEKILRENYSKADEFRKLIRINAAGILAFYENSYFIISSGKKTRVSADFSDNRFRAIFDKHGGDGVVSYDSQTMMGRLKCAVSDDRIFETELYHNETVTSKKSLSVLYSILEK